MLIGLVGPVLAEGPVKVSVLSILATDTHDKVHPKVECIAREVRKVEPKLTGFDLARSTCKSVAVGARETFELADNQSATVVIDRWTGEDKKERVQLKITPPMLGEITYTSACGKFLPIVTRHRTANNELLILAVRVQHCSGKDK
jgi:hypothetical protein